MKEIIIVFPNNEQAQKFKEAAKLPWSHLDCHTHQLKCEADEAIIKLAGEFKGKLKS